MSRSSNISLFISSSLSCFPVRRISPHLLISLLVLFFLHAFLGSSNLSRSKPGLLLLAMAMKFQGLPRDQDMVRRTFQKEFEESFGKNANAKSIYLAAPAQLPRFARLFPRPAYLLGHLQAFHRNLGTTLDVFVAEYYDRGISGHRAEPERFQDPFSYFIAGYDYASVLLHLPNALRVDNRSPSYRRRTAFG